MKRKKKHGLRVRPSFQEAAATAVTSSAGASVAVAAVGASPLMILIAGLPAGLKYAYQGIQAVVSERNAARLMVSGAEALGTNEEGLIQAVRDAGINALPLTLEVFDAAARTMNEKKIDALARVWAHGLRDDANLVQDAMMVRCLAQLEAPHIQVLKSFDDVKIYSEISVHQALDHLKPMVSAILNTLVQVGMLNDQAQQQAFEGRYYQIDEWGRLALKYLNDRANTE